MYGEGRTAVDLTYITQKMKYMAHKSANGNGADLLRLSPSNVAISCVYNYVRSLSR
jgi:hypothetical protein